MLRLFMAIALLASFVTLGGCASVAEPPTEIALPYVKLFSENDPGDTLPNGWRVWTISRFKKSTEYKLVDTDGRTAVNAQTGGSPASLSRRRPGGQRVAPS